MNTMTLEQALDVLGPERVRKGMRAIDDRRDPDRFGPCSTCFVGEAFGGTASGYLSAWRSGTTTDWEAAMTVEAAFEGFRHRPFTKEDLRTACVVYLAEHGEAVEPSVLCPAVRERT